MCVCTNYITTNNIYLFNLFIIKGFTCSSVCSFQNYRNYKEKQKEVIQGMTQELKLLIGFMAAFLVYTAIVFATGAYAAYEWKDREVHNILAVQEITEYQRCIGEIVAIHDGWLIKDRERLDGLQRGYDSLVEKINARHTR